MSTPMKDEFIGRLLIVRPGRGKGKGRVASLVRLGRAHRAAWLSEPRAAEVFASFKGVDVISSVALGSYFMPGTRLFAYFSESFRLPIFKWPALHVVYRGASVNYAIPCFPFQGYRVDRTICGTCNEASSF